MQIILYKTVGRRDKYRPTVERLFRLPMGAALRVYEKDARGAKKKKTVADKKYFSGGGTKTPKATVKTSAYAARICNTATLISSRLALYFTAAARMVSA